MRVDPSQVIVVSGAQQAFDLAARVLLDPGDLAAVEDPGYRGARAALLAAGAQVTGVRVDRDGIDHATLRVLSPVPRLACVTPSHQFPLGVTLSAARRLALLDLARTHGTWIVEDDFDSKYRFRGRPLPSLQGMDPDGRVIYVGTFSKTLFPALRLGYLVVPPSPDTCGACAPCTPKVRRSCCSCSAERRRCGARASRSTPGCTSWSGVAAFDRATMTRGVDVFSQLARALPIDKEGAPGQVVDVTPSPLS